MSDIFVYGIYAFSAFLVGRLFDRVRNLEKAISRIDPNALKEVKVESAGKTYW